MPEIQQHAIHSTTKAFGSQVICAIYACFLEKNSEPISRLARREWIQCSLSLCELQWSTMVKLTPMGESMEKRSSFVKKVSLMEKKNDRYLAGNLHRLRNYSSLATMIQERLYLSPSSYESVHGPAIQATNHSSLKTHFKWSSHINFNIL